MKTEMDVLVMESYMITKKTKACPSEEWTSVATTTGEVTA
jgi:hypothetical protein